MKTALSFFAAIEAANYRTIDGADCRFSIHLHHDAGGYHVGVFRGRHLWANTYNLTCLASARRTIAGYRRQYALKGVATIDHTRAA